MFFKFLKRSPPPAPPKPKKRRPSNSRLAELPTEPSALPEVQEGSDHKDWELWENSVAAMDSRLQSIDPTISRFRQELDQPSEFQDVEAYAQVKKKDP